ncbi:dihydrolipoamide acetyltransferase family protein [Flavobacterium luteum]|uniref:Dihydrolipoamide acetyltransferase component of pyruvate dehydrogenase complex n=1 Tax=Flavobacterium luteum TaxID=2026654 RepID=A0A7J5AJD7_9FLAO|nr:dihydrolipoamide acetyltransferase family protein [Flavobacterium luteum]KAB1157732.1 2-oxo acid dehydrogenase subunit E2 [Flavobacterium luteum]
MIEFQMPSLGADMEDGTLVEWKKKPGDKVKRGDIIAEVETQKGLIEIEVFDEGTIQELLIKEGTKIPVGTVMAIINPSEVTLEAKEEKTPESKPIEIQPIEEKIIVKKEKIKQKASPLARRIAEENKIDITTLKGTGPEGAVSKEDVELAIANQQPTEKAISPSDSIRSAVAAAMSKSNKEIPHYYLIKNIDISKALNWLKEINSHKPVKNRLLPIVLFIKATAKALVEFPDLNAVWENGIIQKKEINIGLVVSLKKGGIVVPAIHQVNLKSIDEIMETLNDLIPRARALKLRSSELSDSTITLTNIGDNGADAVFGIIYPPQVAIVGFGSITEQPIAENGMIGIKSCVTVTLAGDHRATDGLTGSRFLVALNYQLQNPELL